MTAAYAEENAGVLATAGLLVTPGTLRLGHRLGADDAVKVLKAAPQKPLESLLSAQVMAANPDLKGKSAGWLVASADNQMKGARLPGAARPGAARPGTAPGTTAAPSEAEPADGEGAMMKARRAVPSAILPPPRRSPVVPEPAARPAAAPQPEASSEGVGTGPDPDVAWWDGLTPEQRRQAVMAAGFANKAGKAPTPQGLRIAAADWKGLDVFARATLVRSNPAAATILPL